MLENDRCTFCHNFTEILLHLLLECEASRGLRNDIAGYLAILCNFRIETSDVDITLGIVISEDFHKLLNLMNTVIKHYIFTCRSNNRQPTVPSAIWKIKDLCNIANSIAVKKCYLDQHNRKRNCWTPCCNCALMSHDLFYFRTTNVLPLWLWMSQLSEELGYGQTPQLLGTEYDVPVYFCLPSHSYTGI